MKFNRVAAAIFAILVVSSSFGFAGMAVAQSSSQAGPQTETRANVTIASYQMDWSDGQDPLMFENDAGEVTSMEGRVNDSVDNPISFVATDIEFEDGAEFPHSKTNVSAAHNASEWTGSDLTVTKTETAPGVDAVNFDTNGSMTAGDVASATFSNFTISSDENKKYLQMALDINSLGANSVVEVRAVDADGDYKAAAINQTRSEGEDLIANATGEGYVFQRQLGEMDTVVVGDGTFNDIEQVEVVVMDGEADISSSMMNVDRSSEYKYGSHLANTDSDDELETVTTYEVNATNAGAIEVTSLSTLDDVFSTATIHGLTVDAIFPGQTVEYEFNQTSERPGYYGVATITLDTGLVSGYDVSYANTRTVEEQPLLESRYISVEYAEDVGDVDPEDVDDADWSDKTSLYTEKGTNVTIDNTVQPGQTSYVEIKVQLQEGEFNSWKSAFEGGGASGAGGRTSGGGLANLPLIGGVFVVLMGLLRKLGL